MSYCKSCNAPIIWAETDNGRRVPMDAKPQKRYLLDNTVEGSWGDTRQAKLVNVYTTHSETCPDADKFRKRR